MSEEDKEKKPLRIAVVGGSGRLAPHIAAELASLAIKTGQQVEVIDAEDLPEAQKRGLLLEPPSISQYHLPTVEVEPETENPDTGGSRYKRGRRWWEQSKWERRR